MTAAANTDDLLKREALQEKRRYAVGTIDYKTVFTINSITTGLVTSTDSLVDKLNENSNSGLSAAFSKNGTDIDLLWDAVGAQATAYPLTRHASIRYHTLTTAGGKLPTASTFPYSLNGGTNYTQITDVAGIVGITDKHAHIESVHNGGQDDVVIAFKTANVTTIGAAEQAIFKRDAVSYTHLTLPTKA